MFDTAKGSLRAWIKNKLGDLEIDLDKPSYGYTFFLNSEIHISQDEKWERDEWFEHDYNDFISELNTERSYITTYSPTQYCRFLAVKAFYEFNFKPEITESMLANWIENGWYSIGYSWGYDQSRPIK